jgi:hypothetical protein
VYTPDGVDQNPRSNGAEEGSVVGVMMTAVMMTVTVVPPVVVVSAGKRRCCEAYDQQG